MPKASKFSPDEGLTIYDLKDSEAVHYGDQSKGYVGKNKAVFNDNNGDNVGVVWNTNADKSITASGTPSSSFGITLNADIKIPAGDYIISNGVENNNNTFQFWVEARHNRTYLKTLGVTDTSHKSVSFTVDYDGYETVAIGLYFVKNTTYNQTIYPMIRLASIPDSTYEPWYMTNLELTENVTNIDITSSIKAIQGTLNQYNNYAYKNGKTLTFAIRLDGVTANGYTDIAKIENVLPISGEGFTMGKIVGGSYVGFKFATTGNDMTLQCIENLSNQGVLIYNTAILIK